MVKNDLAGFGLRSDLGKPNHGFYRLHLAEKGSKAAEHVMAPVLKQTSRLRGDLTLIGIRQVTPRVHMTAHVIYDRSRIVLLLLYRKPLAFIKNEGRLRNGCFVLL
jgi:hypothetical protein